ncbi:hypothetical protein QAD02_021280 [Eretmocerus hayati]|uniref:Uncharacterized protein n=1 Tax=Eretmocerus hayati TaxID=131215 RepID=A0ACC2PQ10_9HYME|nr:hypothetical protein QAD02_021280 [Eretmocerus hayati]
MSSQCIDKSESSNMDLKSAVLDEMRQQVREASENVRNPRNLARLAAKNARSAQKALDVLRRQLFTVLQTIVSMKSDCNNEVKNSVCRRIESLPNGNAETQNGKLANINYEICLPQTVPPIEIVPNSKPSNDDSDVEYLGISNTIETVINQSAKYNTKSGTSSNEPKAAANMHCINDTGITATLTCTDSPGSSAVAPFIRGPSMTANAAYINTAGVSAATPYVQSACETVERAYTNAPRVSAAAPCLQDASSTAITQYMQSTSETMKPASTYTSTAPSATLCVPSASVTAAGYTNTVESQKAEYAYSNGTTTTGRVTYASVDLTPIDSSQRYDNSKILTAHETPIFTN